MKLKIEHLFSGYDSDVVLKDLSLEVAEGEFLSLSKVENGTLSTIKSFFDV